MGSHTPLTHGWSPASQQRHKHREWAHHLVPGQTLCASLQGEDDKPSGGGPSTISLGGEKCQEEDFVAADGLP